MKLFADKCHLLVLGQRFDDPVTFTIGNADVVNSSEEKLLGAQIDSRLSFGNHVSKLCQKASNKLYTLARISPRMDQSKLRAFMRAFITSQFQYSPLILMFHSRQLNQKISKRQECFSCARMLPQPVKGLICHILNQRIQMRYLLERHET